MAETASTLAGGRPSYETADGRFDEDRLREFVDDYDGPEDPDYPGCVPIPDDARAIRQLRGRRRILEPRARHRVDLPGWLAGARDPRRPVAGPPHACRAWSVARRSFVAVP